MKLLEVLPLTRTPNILPDTLSYYAGNDVAVGSLVLISIQKKQCVAVVAKTIPLAEVRIAIRKQSFPLRKIDAMLAGSVVPEFLLKLCAWSAKFFLTRANYLMRAALPSYFAKSPKFLQKSLAQKNEIARAPAPASSRVMPSSAPVFAEGTIAARAKYYIQSIADVFQENQNPQILILCPTTLAAEAIADEMKNHFPGKVSAYGSFIKGKALAEVWLAAKGNKSGIFIGTRSAVFLPLPSLTLIIIEQGGSAMHKSWESEPRYDARDIAEKISEVTGAKLILGDNVPTTEIWHGIHDGLWRHERLSQDIISHIEIIDVKKTLPTVRSLENNKIAGEFRTISPVLAEKISTCLKAQIPILLFAGRRGFALNLICQECGFIFICPRCSAPLVMHETRDPLVTRVLVCRRCLKQEKPLDICPSCQSAHIKTLGIGAQRIEAEIRELFPAARVIRIDGDMSAHAAKLNEQLENIRNRKCDIVVGTEIIAKPELSGYFGFAAVVSLRQLLGHADFRQEERALHLIATLSELAKNNVALQTDSPEEPLARDLKNFAPEIFFRRDANFRKMFFYPPFAEIIKLSVKNKVRLLAEKNILLVEKLLSDELQRLSLANAVDVIGPLPAFISRVKEQFIYIIVLKIKYNNNEIKKMLARMLPPNVMREVDPVNIL